MSDPPIIIAARRVQRYRKDLLREDEWEDEDVDGKINVYKGIATAEEEIEETICGDRLFKVFGVRQVGCLAKVGVKPVSIEALGTGKYS